MVNPDPRELDMMVSTGEQVTIAMTAMALIELGRQSQELIRAAKYVS